MLTTFSDIGPRIAFQLVHKTTLWLLMAFFLTAMAAWHLSLILSKHNGRLKEAQLARYTAFAYAALGLSFWLFSFIFS